MALRVSVEAPRESGPVEARLEVEMMPSDHVEVDRAGVIAAIEDLGPIAKGTKVVSLSGAAIDADIARAERRLRRLRAQHDALLEQIPLLQNRGDNDRAAQASAEVRDLIHQLADTQRELNVKSAELAPLEFFAPSSGRFIPLARTAQVVFAGMVVGRIEHERLVATFVRDRSAREVGDPIDVAGARGTVTCTVAELQPDRVKVACPADSTLADGAVVRLDAAFTSR